MPPKKRIMKMKIIIYLTITIFALVSNCTYVVSGRKACIYLEDLKNDPNGFLEWQFSMNKDKEFKDTCINCHSVKITIDIDSWETKFASRDTIPEEYFKLHPRDKREYEKRKAFFNLGGWNASSRGEIYRVEILEDSLPIEVPFIDYEEHSWGSRNFHFKSNAFCIIPLKIVAKSDTIYSTIKVEKDTLVMDDMCTVHKKQKKGISLNPLTWPRIMITLIKGKRLEKT